MILNEIICYAAVQVLPWILGGVAYFTLLWWICNVLDSDPQPVEGKSIAVLGMQEAGKTLMLATLQNKEYNNYSATVGEEPYSEFNLKTGEKSIKIKSGKDIGGGVEYCHRYEDMINSCDIVFFLFDGYKYLHDKKYEKNAKARLDFIHRKKGAKQVVVIATHKDKFDYPDKAYRDILATVFRKSSYRELFETNFLFLNMRDKNDFLSKFVKIIS